MPVLLIVDDNAELASLLGAVAEASGFAVRIAHSGSEALALMNAARPDAGLVDLLLPDVRGHEILARLRDLAIPSAAMSGVFKGNYFVREATEKYGAGAFFEKPFVARDAMRTLAALIESAPRPSSSSVGDLQELTVGEFVAAETTGAFARLSPVEPAPEAPEQTAPEPSPEIADALARGAIPEDHAASEIKTQVFDLGALASESCVDAPPAPGGPEEAGGASSLVPPPEVQPLDAAFTPSACPDVGERPPESGPAGADEAADAPSQVEADASDEPSFTPSANPDVGEGPPESGPAGADEAADAPSQVETDASDEPSFAPPPEVTDESWAYAPVLADAQPGATDAVDRLGAGESSREPPPEMGAIPFGSRDVWSPRAPAIPSRPGELDPAQGDLSQTSLPRLLTAFYLGRQTGELKITRAGVAKVIGLLEGELAYAASNVSAERFGRHAVRAGKLAAEALVHVQREAVAANMRTGDAMIALGLISEAERRDLVETQVKEIAWSLLDWTQGEYQFVVRHAPRKDLIPLSLHPATLVLEGFRRSQTLVRLRTLVQPGARYRPSEDPPYGLHELVLSDREAVLLAYADGVKTVEDLVALSDLHEREALALIYALHQLGILAPRSALRSESRIVLV